MAGYAEGAVLSGAEAAGAARALLAEALHCELAEIGAQAALGDPEAWDSIGHMRLVLSLEERLGRMLSAEEIVGIASLADVAALLSGPKG